MTGILIMMAAAVIRVPLTCQAADLKQITASDLKAGAGRWVILDARPVKVWKKGHIPGALSFSWETYTHTDDDNIPYRMLPPEAMADVLGNLGVTRRSRVAVYGDADTSWGGEGWVCWVLNLMGHQGEIGLLHGGIQSWRLLGYPLEPDGQGITDDGKNKSKAAYVPEIRPGLTLSAQELDRNRDRLQLVDTRSFREWMFGHLPGAVHIPWKDFFGGTANAALPGDSVALLLKKNGIDPMLPVVYYCTGGIRSGYAWAVHELAGLPTAVNFEGGTEEWDRRNP